MTPLYKFYKYTRQRPDGKWVALTPEGETLNDFCNTQEQAAQVVRDYANP